MHDIKVIIIDDEQMIGTMLTTWLSSLAGFRVLGCSRTGDEGIALCQRQKPDIVLLDIEMPRMSGLTVAQHLRHEVPSARVVFLSSHVDSYCISEIARAGVWGYVNKGVTLDLLELCLTHVAAGRRFYAPVYHTIQARRLSGPDAFTRILTPKQLAVLMLVVQGIDDMEIAALLDVSPSTVASHRKSLRTKLNAHNDRDLIRYARKWGLDPLDADSGESDQ